MAKDVKTKNVKRANQLSDFWIVDKSFDASKYDSLVVDRSIKGYMKLAAMRRSISDFVRIVTRKPIPVEFLTKDQAAGFTDGKRVFISSKIEKGDLDSTVGLALHEASHILLTDMRLLLHLGNSIPDAVYKAGEKKGASKKITEHLVKNILNWIEDRRIDHFLYTESPGYRGYYRALYNRYFYADIVTKGLQSDKYRTEDIDSYMFRFINMINSASQLDALNGLQEIYDIVNIKTIDRLRDTGQSLTSSLAVVETMFKYIEKIDTEKMEQQIGDGDGEPSDGEDGDSDSDGSGKKKRKIIYDPTGKPSDGAKKGKIKLTKEELEDLLDQIAKQGDFLDGKIQKIKLSGDDLNKVNQISDAGTEIKNIKINPPKNQRRDYDSVYNVKEYNVTVLKRVTLEMADSGTLDFISAGNSYYGNNITLNEQAVRDGIRIGKQLGRKLQIRNEEKLTRYTRKEHGKMDKRLMAELGFGNESVFQQTFVELYSDAILHMSIDVSGSMSGDKLANAIKVATAVCIAARMIKNLDIVVDVRSTEGFGDPFVAIIYDSRVDNVVKIKKLFPRIETSGTTPEGLCFAAIQDLIESSTTKLHSYFLNLSDGEPYFSGYSGTLAAEHTRGEVNKMRQRGIKVLSYFISDGNYHHAQFELMYGKSAAYINPDSLMDIARTLNKMFLSKDEN